jgi:hypothetical protein
MMSCKYETQKDHFSFLPHQNFRRFPADHWEKNGKTGLWPRIAVTAEITKIRRLHALPVRTCRPTETALQQSRSSRSGETPAFAYIYRTNQLLNGFMRRL